MTKNDLKQLRQGDIVKYINDPRTFIVTANYGDRVTAVTSVDITNPPEWEIVMKLEEIPR